MKDGLFEPEIVADYLLYKLNARMAAEELGLEGVPRRTCWFLVLLLTMQTIATLPDFRFPLASRGQTFSLNLWTR